MLRVLMFLVPLALTIFAVVDCIQTDEAEVRSLPKFVWILLILLFWIVGPIAWLLAGRPRRAGGDRALPWPSGTTPGVPEYERPRPLAPDDDPDFLSSLDRGNAEHEEMLAKWEEDLKRREDEMRKDGPDQADKDDRDG